MALFHFSPDGSHDLGNLQSFFGGWRILIQADAHPGRVGINPFFKPMRLSPEIHDKEIDLAFGV